MDSITSTTQETQPITKPDEPKQGESPHKQRKQTKIKQIKSMVIAGMTERDIAKATDTAKTTIHSLIHKSFSQDELATFRQAEANILATKRAEILNSIDHEDIKDSSLLQRATTYAIMYDKQALLEGRCTSISDLDIRMLIAQIPNNVDTK